MIHTAPISDLRRREILRDTDDLWARAFCLPGGASLEALLDWLEARP